MTMIKNEAGNLLPMSVMEGVTVSVLPDKEHEFLMATKDVAAGYGVSPGTVRRHAQEHVDELIENRHYFRSVQILNDVPTGGATRTTMWTKAGVVRLGFFIKSERARLFRDWAEGLILAVVGERAGVLRGMVKRRHNRLSPGRLADILADVCRISDGELRLRLLSKLMDGGHGDGTV